MLEHGLLRLKASLDSTTSKALTVDVPRWNTFLRHAASLTTPLGNGNDLPGNWQASWVDNGTPGAANSSAFGCNNPDACNFNANAILGDESQCTFDCVGCTTPMQTTSLRVRHKTTVRAIHHCQSMSHGLEWRRFDDHG